MGIFADVIIARGGVAAQDNAGDFGKLSRSFVATNMTSAMASIQEQGFNAQTTSAAVVAGQLARLLQELIRKRVIDGRASTGA